MILVRKQKEFGIISGLGRLLGAGLIKTGAVAYTHPVTAGALAAYGIYKLLKRRRERKREEY